MGKTRHVRKKKEHSKLVTMILLVNVLAMEWAALYAMIRAGDLTALNFFITGANAALSIVMGFYFYKAKAENTIKLDKAFDTSELTPLENVKPLYPQNYIPR